MDHVLRVGDEVIQAGTGPPSGPPAKPSGPPPVPPAEADAERDARKIRHVVDRADAMESRPYGCMTGILIALVAFAATLGITVAVAAVVGGESGPLDTLPKGKPVATTAAITPPTTARAPATSAPSPTSTSLPVGGVQPPTEVIPGVIELPPDPNVPPPSTEHQPPSSQHQPGG